MAVTKDAKGKMEFHQTVNLTAAGATSGGFWGMLIGIDGSLTPLLGLAVGALVVRCPEHWSISGSTISSWRIWPQP